MRLQNRRDNFANSIESIEMPIMQPSRAPSLSVWADSDGDRSVHPKTVISAAVAGDRSRQGLARSTVDIGVGDVGGGKAIQQMTV